MMQDLRTYVEDRCIPIPFAGCWMWIMSLGSHGYGQGYTKKHGVTVAHRLSYEAFKGPIPDNMLIQHNCDTRWCVNPDHLSLGTDATNALDKQGKGRAAKKLSDHEVMSILDRLSLGHIVNKIANDYGVNHSMVARIRDGKAWTHVKRKAS